MEFICKCTVYERVNTANKDGLISSYDVTSAVDDFFQWCDPSTATLREEVCGPQEGLCWKINFILTHSMKVSRSAYECFTQPWPHRLGFWYALCM